MLTILTLTAADAGYMRLMTGVKEISNETMTLCADFVKHYNDKAVFTEISISGPMSDVYYDNIVTTINFIALMPPEERELALG